MLIGYIRPFHDDPSCEKQKGQLIELNCAIIIEEEHSLPTKRIRLKEMLNGLVENDKIVVTKLSAFADSTRNLADLLEKIEGKGAYLATLAENIDTSSRKGYTFLDIVNSLVDFQFDLTSEKTKTGLSEAKQKGIVTGRPRKPDINVQKAIEMYDSKEYTLKEIKEETGISKSTLYRYLELSTRKPDEHVQRAMAMYQSQSYTLKEIKEETGISKSTLFRYLEITTGELDNNLKKAIEMYQSKQFTLDQITKMTGISKTTIYRYLEN